MTGLLHAELRKSLSTRLWWGLLIPVVALSLVVNAFGGLFTDLVGAIEPGGPVPPLVLLSLAYSLSLTSVFATVLGAVGAGGEFRHRTITTTYLSGGGRTGVLAAKAAVAALFGTGYAVAAGLVGALIGLLSDSAPPTVLALVQVVVVGAVVCALWAVVGVALGVALGNQVGALVLALVYLLVGELLLGTLLRQAESPAVAGLSAYLPGNAGDVALYDLAVREVFGPIGTEEAVEFLATVTDPPAWWAGLLVLALWTAVLGAAAAVVGHQRDVS